MGFPERLKELRLKKGLTQKEIAENLGSNNLIISNGKVEKENHRLKL